MTINIMLRDRSDTIDYQPTKLQMDFIESKQHLDPCLLLDSPSGVIQVQSGGREGGVRWKRTWVVLPAGEVIATDYDFDGNRGNTC